MAFGNYQEPKSLYAFRVQKVQAARRTKWYQSSFKQKVGSGKASRKSLVRGKGSVKNTPLVFCEKVHKEPVDQQSEGLRVWFDLAVHSS